MIYPALPLAFTARSLALTDYVVLAAYLALNLVIGWWCARKKAAGSAGYFLGGRQVSWWAAAISFFATATSSISFMALPAKTFTTDWLAFGSAPAQAIAGLIVGFFLVGLLRRLNLTTVYGYLEQRFDRRVRLLGAGLGVLLKVGGRMSVVMLLPALALATVTGMNVYVIILSMGIVTTIYAMEGGFEAVVWTDVMQTVVMLGGVTMAVYYIITGVPGGFSEVMSRGDAAGKFHMVSWERDVSSPTVWVFIGMFLAHIFAQVSDQPLMQRMLATSDVKQAQRTVVIGNMIGLASSVVFFFVGSALWVFYGAHPERLAAGVPNDAIFPYFIANELPVGVVGLIVAALFAAAMGALSSAINSTATIIVSDFQGTIHPAATDVSKVRLAKLSTVICGILGTGMAMYLAYRNVPSLWDEFLKLIALIGGGFPGVFALGLLTRRATSSGVIVGAVASIVITWWVQNYTTVNVFLHGFVAVASCMIIGYLASLFIGTKNVSRIGTKLTFWDVAALPQTTAVEK